MQDGEWKPPETHEKPPTIPVTHLVIIGLVALGCIVNLFLPHGIVVWPFVFAVSILLLLNEASDRNEVGVPPLQAYALFFGVLVVFFIFVLLISKAINPWLLILLSIGATWFVIRDWKQRRERNAEIDRLRALGLCVRCKTKVGDDPNAECANCGLAANPERLRLFYLAKAVKFQGRSDADVYPRCGILSLPEPSYF